MIMNIIILLGIVAILGGMWYLNKKRHDAMLALAGKLGWSQITDMFGLNSFLAPSLANQGIRSSFDIAFGLKLDTVDAYLYEFTYVTESTSTDAQGHTQRSEEKHTYTVLNFPLAKAEGNFHMHHRGLMNLNREFLYAGMTRLQVEGELNKHFDIFVPEGQQIEALQALEPDVMAIILDKGTNYSLDLANFRLSIIADGHHITEEKFQALSEYAKLLLAKVD